MKTVILSNKEKINSEGKSQVENGKAIHMSGISRTKYEFTKENIKVKG